MTLLRVSNTCRHFVILLALMLFSPVVVGANQIAPTQIRVYFVGWDILTRVALRPEDVRRMRHVYMEISEPHWKISAIVKKIDNLNCTKEFSVGDIRLVVDIVKDSKVVKSVYADKDFVYLSDGSVCDNSDEIFSFLNMF